jgi:hypothetical protein
MSGNTTTITRNILFLSGFVLSQLCFAQSANAPVGEFKTVSITGGRAVADATEMLEKIYGWPITYEDPIAVHESQLQDVTEQVQRTPAPSHRVIVQKDITLSFTYKLPPSGPTPGDEQQRIQTDTESSVSDALKSVIDGYSAAGGPVSFTVTEENGVFHIVPTNFLNKEGKLQLMTPILDTKITILPKQRTRQQLANEIADSLCKATGINIGIGQFPYNGGSTQAQTLTTISGSDVTARSLLSQLLAELGAPITQEVSFDGPDGHSLTRNRVVWKGATLSWQLFYGPGWGYALNIHGVTIANQ